MEEGVGGHPNLDEGVEDVGEVLVGVPVPGVDAAVLVIELDRASDRLGQGESRKIILKY